jgi:hypothetical protein
MRGYLMQQRLLDKSELKKVICLLEKTGCDIEDLYRILCSQFLVDLDDVKKIVQAN